MKRSLAPRRAGLAVAALLAHVLAAAAGFGEPGGPLLIRPERDGRTVRYVADMTGFRDLLAYLMEDCCNGAPELCRPVINAVTCDC